LKSGKCTHLIFGRLASTSLGWTVLSASIGLGMTFLLLFLVLKMFVPIGRILGRLMDTHRNVVVAYSTNIVGSLVGTWLLVGLSIFCLPPVTWFAVLGGLLLFFFNRENPAWKRNVAVLAIIVGLSFFAGLESGAIRTVWSPYQKLALWRYGHDNPFKLKKNIIRLLAKVGSPFRNLPQAVSSEDPPDLNRYVLRVNNTWYQAILDLSAGTIGAHPDLFPPEMSGVSQYDIPLLVHPNPKSVLIVGAGTGNDAAGALRQGAERVVCVEIDPAIIELGKRYHPEKPYFSPRVKVVQDDARSFFATCGEKFDVISFGLLDSHTGTTLTNARLDHYVYTRESFAKARSLLADGGVMAVSFAAQKMFIVDRMARVVRDTFQAEPIRFLIPPGNYGWGGMMFLTGDLDTVRRQIAGNPKLGALVAAWNRDPMKVTYTTPVATDDWPYIYLESRKIPLLFYLLTGVMILLFMLERYRVRASVPLTRWTREHWHFFFLGAAFLLLEVQNISKASVVLGSTWWVNSIVISGVLVMILLANILAPLFPRLGSKPAYFALFGICAVLYGIDLARFGFLPYVSKAILVGILTSLPMLFSGMIFITSFAGAPRKDEALGANLFGALVGGLLQSLTFVTGIKFLLIAVAALYLLALLTRPRAQQEASFAGVGCAQ
jgi:predicted RNA methylase